VYFAWEKFDVPADQICFIFTFVHTTDMLLEVVQTRPNLVSVPAILRCALVRVLLNTDPVNTLLVPLEIIDGGEALSRCSSAATHDIAGMRLVMFEHVLPTHARSALICNQAGDTYL
jgi:hypothetical protein